MKIFVARPYLLTGKSKIFSNFFFPLIITQGHTGSDKDTHVRYCQTRLNKDNKDTRVRYCQTRLNKDNKDTHVRYCQTRDDRK